MTKERKQEIINTYKSEEYEHYEKLITIRENELKENLDKLLYNVINKEKIERDIEVFKRKFNFSSKLLISESFGQMVRYCCKSGRHSCWWPVLASASILLRNWAAKA